MIPNEMDLVADTRLASVTVADTRLASVTVQAETNEIVAIYVSCINIPN